MMHDALGAHAAVGEFPPAAVSQTPAGFRDGPAPASARVPEHRVYDAALGVIAAPTRAHRRTAGDRTAGDRTDTAAPC